MPFYRRVRGVRASLPSGSVIGRKSAGQGAAEIVSPGDIVRAGSVSAPAPSPGPGGTGVGTDGQVWATVGTAAAWSFLSLLTKVGTITVGVWNATKIGLLYGGTNADLSGTGGTHSFLKQASTGAAITVAQVDYTDLSGTQPVNAITQLTGDVTAGPGTGSQAATLAASGVTAATYGDATHTPQIAVDAKGRITSASSVAISGGTGTVTHTGGVLTAHAPIVGAGSDDEKALAAMTNGQLMIGNTGSDPTLTTLTAGNAINITNGAGSIAIKVPDTAVTPGSYTLSSITVDQQGRITAASSGAGGGSGTVTSVAMTVPAELSVAGSAITTSGTLAVTWATESDSTILANITGGSSVPSFSTVTAVLDHAVGNTNDKFAIRRSGSWTQDTIASALTAGTGISITGTTNATISGAYTAGAGISISGATITNTGASGAPGGSTDFIAPIYAGGPPSIMRGFGEHSVDGAAGTGAVGTGPVGMQTIQWQTPLQKGDFVIWDGAQWANSHVISANNFYPNTSKYGSVGTPMLELCAADGTPTRLILSSFEGTGPGGTVFSTINLRYSRGTSELPTAVQSGDICATAFAVHGYAATDFSTAAVRFRATALDTFTGSAYGMFWNIQATPAGSVTIYDTVYIKQEGLEVLAAGVEPTGGAKGTGTINAGTYPSFYTNGNWEGGPVNQAPPASGSITIAANHSLIFVRKYTPPNNAKLILGDGAWLKGL